MSNYTESVFNMLEIRYTVVKFKGETCFLICTQQYF